ncbi:hypothetical protein [Hymenobacter crusticola]|uniref:Nucleoside 2-deoxyribosyltransferase n=1 Tax=Hymenobacter crusticola TaxID=1770526 RepID=A0A243W5W3_9BACT|nr:hypothetical protein [Hymenobacter crusticola]OUJ68979.1 hypothetical protein BXP70_27120 [Hymenobacter crusticola]
METTLLNPFTDKPIDPRSVVSNIKPRDGLTDTTVAIQLATPLSNRDEVFFIEWDFLHHHQEDKEYQKIKTLIQGLWQNSYPLIGSLEVISLELLQKKLATAPIPRTPKEKLDNLILFLAKKQTEDGASVKFHYLTEYKRLYFKSKNEAYFYQQTLVTNGFLKQQGGPDTDGSLVVELTYRGLAYVIELESAGPSSNYCFIALSFASQMEEYRDTIARVVEYHGYQPIIVNSDFVVTSDTPVIDEILAGIKRSKFCIADFTMQRTGVYFEAGYALGLGRPVIYISERKDFEANAHFDLRPFQHILYSDAQELEKALSVKIAAWIGSLNPEYKS